MALLNILQLDFFDMFFENKIIFSFIHFVFSKMGPKEKGKKKKTVARQSISDQIANDQNLEVEHKQKVQQQQRRDKPKDKAKAESDTMDVDGSPSSPPPPSSTSSSSRKRKDSALLPPASRNKPSSSSSSLHDAHSSKRRKGSHMQSSGFVDGVASAKILRMAAEQLKEEESDEDEGRPSDGSTSALSHHIGLEEDDVSGLLLPHLSHSFSQCLTVSSFSFFF